MLRTLEPHSKILSETYFTDIVVPALYNKSWAQLEPSVSVVPTVALTSGCWTWRTTTNSYSTLYYTRMGEEKRHSSDMVPQQSQHWWFSQWSDRSCGRLEVCVTNLWRLTMIRMYVTVSQAMAWGRKCDALHIPLS